MHYAKMYRGNWVGFLLSARIWRVSSYPSLSLEFVDAHTEFQSGFCVTCSLTRRRQRQIQSDGIASEKDRKTEENSPWTVTLK